MLIAFEFEFVPPEVIVPVESPAVAVGETSVGMVGGCDGISGALVGCTGSVGAFVDGSGVSDDCGNNDGSSVGGDGVVTETSSSNGQAMLLSGANV